MKAQKKIAKNPGEPEADLHREDGDDMPEAGNRAGRGRKVKRIATLSFWLIIAAHIAAFTAIGLFTSRGWRLLSIFICGAAVIFAARFAFRLYVRKRRKKV